MRLRRFSVETVIFSDWQRSQRGKSIYYNVPLAPLTIRRFTLSRLYLRLLLIRSFTFRLTMTSADSCTFSTASFPCTVVTSFKAFRTGLPGYHTFLSLHPSATFIPRDSVQLLGFDLCGSLTLTKDLICDFCPSDQRFARG